MFTEYHGYYIEFNLYGANEYSVQYCGDDVIFKTEEEAKVFIDEMNDHEKILESDIVLRG